jgi:hypothetical protein
MPTADVSSNARQGNGKKAQRITRPLLVKNPTLGAQTGMSRKGRERPFVERQEMAGKRAYKRCRARRGVRPDQTFLFML